MARQALEPDDYPFFDYRRFTFSLGIAASDHVWLSGSTAVRFDPARRAMVVDGNLVAQARVIYDKMSKTLAARGWCLGHVVRMVQYVTPAAVPDLQKLAYFRYSLFPDRPSVSTIVVKRLLREEALIEIEGVAADGAHDEIDYLPAIVADDGTQAWRLAGEALQARRLTWDNVLRTIEFRSPDVINPTPRPAGVEAKATLGVVMPQLSTRAKGVQIEIVTGDRRGNVMFAQAEGDPAAGNVIEQCRQAYAQIGLARPNATRASTPWLRPRSSSRRRDCPNTGKPPMCAERCSRRPTLPQPASCAIASRYRARTYPSRRRRS